MNPSVPRLALPLLGALASVPAQATAQEPVRVEGPAPMRFERTLLLEDSAAPSANVSVGDVDGDGHLDIVLVKGRHWPLVDFLLVGDGAGGFPSRRTLRAEADRSYSGELADVDGDGDLDVVVSNDRPDPNVVHLNDGDGRFTVGSTFGDPEWPTRHIRLAHLDDDGRIDVVLANRTGNRGGASYVCFGERGGRFSPECLALAEESATTIAPADFDGDGRVDLGVPNRDGGQSYIYLNGGDRTFGERIPFGPPDASIRSAEAADFDGDGVLDIVAIDERNGPAILFGEPGLSFGPPRRLGSGEAIPYALAVSDLDGDGDADVVIGYVESRPVAYFGDGAGGFAAAPFGDDQGVAYGFAFGDLDEDGSVDIAMARSDAPNVLYFGAR